MMAPTHIAVGDFLAKLFGEEVAFVLLFRSAQIEHDTVKICTSVETELLPDILEAVAESLRETDVETQIRYVKLDGKPS